MPTAAVVKVFGCRPLANDCHKHGRPAYENLQWKKPREIGCAVRRTLWGFERRRWWSWWAAERCNRLKEGELAYR